MLQRTIHFSTARIIILALCGLGLLASILGDNHTLEVQREDLHWQQIHLPPSLLAVRADLCSSNQQHFIGCYRAIRALLSLDELSHLSRLVPRWNDSDEALLAKQFRLHRRHALINFQAAFDRLNREIRIHVARSAESEAVAYALNRWLMAIDPHARLRPTSWESEQAQGAAQIEGGVGILWKNLRGKTLIVTVRKNSPAHKAGIQGGDQILAVDGIDFQRTSHQKKRYLVLGDGSEPVRLTLLRRNKRVDISLAPQHSFQTNVEFAIDHETANIRIHSFQPSSTCRDTGRLLLKAEFRKTKKIHLDLRDNPGGHVDEALCVAGLLLGANWRFAEIRPIPRRVYLLPFTEQKYQPRTLITNRAQLTSLPLTVSVNHNTASAAEMLAAALQDHGRAIISGTRSFGKGTMQSGVHPWNRNDLSLHISTHLIYRPSGLALHHRGVEPDKIDPSENENIEWRLREKNLYPRFPLWRGA